MGVEHIISFRTKHELQPRELFKSLKDISLLARALGIESPDSKTADSISFTNSSFFIKIKKHGGYTLIRLVAPLNSDHRMAKDIISLSKTIYAIVHPKIGFSWYDDASITPDYSEISIGWLTFLGPELVRELGRKKLLNAPAYKLEEFPDGGIFIQASYAPRLFGLDSNEFKKLNNPSKEQIDFYDEDEQVKKIRAHLGISGVKSK